MTLSNQFSRSAVASHLEVIARTLLGGILLGVSLNACVGSNGDTQFALTTSVVTHGDTTVVRTVGDIPESQELRLREVWRAGDAEGDENTSFSRASEVAGVAVGASGDVFVFEGSLPQLRHYTADGSLLGVVGHKGAGPGEYTRSNGLVVLRDGRLVLWDRGTSRLNVYAADGTFLETWNVPMLGYGSGDNALVAIDGGLGVRGFVRDSVPTDNILGRDAWFRIDSTGALRDTVIVPALGAPPRMVIVRSEHGAATYPVPFTSRPSTRMNAQGRVVGAPGAPYAIFSWNGARPMRIEREIAQIEISPEEQTLQRERLISNVRRADPAWQWTGPDIPNVKPPVLALAGTLDEQTLVRINTPSVPFTPEVDPNAKPDASGSAPARQFRSATVYELFDREGKLRGRFRMPAGALLHALRGDDAWGVVTDSLDIPYLVRWRLEKP